MSQDAGKIFAALLSLLRFFFLLRGGYPHCIRNCIMQFDICLEGDIFISPVYRISVAVRFLFCGTLHSPP